MILKDISLATSEENIFYDDVLLKMAEYGVSGEVSRLWESRELFIVLGRICEEEEDVNVEEVLKDNIPILRRSSGGGTVLQGKGCLNYSLVLSKEKDPRIADLHSSYSFILNKVLEVVNILGISADFKPVSDLAITESEKKFSGNAQRRTRKFILHHGTILYDFNLELITKYLKIPKKIPDYRLGRSHSDFVTNIDRPLGEIKRGFCEVFGVTEKQYLLNDKEKKYLESFCNTTDKEKAVQK